MSPDRELPADDPRDEIERIRRKLSELSDVLDRIGATSRKTARGRRDALGRFDAASVDGAKPDGLAPFLEAPNLDDDEKREKARSILDRPTTFETGDDTVRYAQYVEFGSIEEMLRFKQLPPIRSEDVAVVDWDDLERRLQS